MEMTRERKRSRNSGFCTYSRHGGTGTPGVLHRVYEAYSRSGAYRAVVLALSNCSPATIATPHTPGDGCNGGNSSAGGGWFSGISWFDEGGRAGGDSTDGGDRTGSHRVERAGDNSFGDGGRRGDGGGASSDD
ncbi:hypothetical protein PGTUg99_029855 [Puccinia graminis f. sp. tritici]|uniref:Uncharacterized protein n=1 Tax=Puccinia graminis f. sp. tritici TaxID=56615 RepID=A0A5B0SKG2_PUCGR|nr:hypothetical protein PGTUg99_029855 [Puccinia graminis f. sp. tritici]